MLESKKTRIISLGDFGFISKGGIYNPSVLERQQDILMLTRVEASYYAYHGDKLTFLPRVFMIYLDKDLKVKNNYLLKLVGFSKQERIEDCRLFQYKDKVLVSGSIFDEDGFFKVFLAELDEKKFSLTLIKKFTSPTFREEKNWGWFVKNDRIYFVYSISPFFIYEYNFLRKTFKVIHSENFKFEWETDRMISISTLPVEYEGNYLSFIHSNIGNLTYIQGALIFSKEDFTTLYFTKERLLEGGKENGIHPGVLYVSGITVDKENINLFYGEADTHTSVRKINREQFNKIIYGN